MLMFWTTNLFAATVEGAWEYEHAFNYYYPDNKIEAPKFLKIEFKNNEVRFNRDCIAALTKQDYFFSSIFQSLAKQGEKEKQLNSFLMKYFKLNMSEVKTIWQLAGTPEHCGDPIKEFFVVGEKILAFEGLTFYMYHKAGMQSGSVSSDTFQGYKLSQLPMNHDDYYSTCNKHILNSERRPQTTEKCAPRYYPYVADPKKNDEIMNVIGNHDFAKAGANYADTFSPAFRWKTRATFLLFKSLNGVLLARVDDFDLIRNEERDRMSFAYITIVNGKIVDQIQGCDVNDRNECIAENAIVAKILPSGEIRRLISSR